MEIKPKLLTSYEHIILLNLQAVFQIIVKYGFDLKKIKYNDFINLITDLKKYKKFPFMYEFNKMIDAIEKIITINEDQKNEYSKNYSRFKESFDKSLTNLRKNNWELFKKNTLELLSLENKILDSYISKESTIRNIFKNPFHFDNLSIFGDPNAILKEFTAKDMETFVNLDLNKFKYSYLKFPDPFKLDMLLYYIKQLKDSEEPVELNKGQFMRYQKFLYLDNKKFNEMIKLIESYMYENNKKVINKVLELLKNFPELYKQNENSKNKIKTVYRGIPVFDEEKISIDQTLAEDLKSDFISTSIYKKVARNFALQIGHLESEESQRSKVGYVVTYSVSYNAIILDLNTFGSIYGESEILINPQRASVANVEMV